jgi:hypothetical protein
MVDMYLNTNRGDGKGQELLGGVFELGYQYCD